MYISFEKLITQLEFALEQLEKHDGDFDRFALLLVDNAVELALRQYAGSFDAFFIVSFKELFRDFVKAKKKNDFHDKVAAAVTDEKNGRKRLISSEEAKSICALHDVRNTSYHQGSYTGSTRALAVFYFKIACKLLREHCAISMVAGDREYGAVFVRLSETVGAMSTNLLHVLTQDMRQKIDSTEHMMNRLDNDKEAVIKQAHAWLFASSDEGKRFAAKLFAEKKFCVNKKRVSEKDAMKPVIEVSPVEFAKFLVEECEWHTVGDPVQQWRENLSILKAAKNEHEAVQIYCEFMKQTEPFRAQISSTHEERFFHEEEPA